MKVGNELGPPNAEPLTTVQVKTLLAICWAMDTAGRATMTEVARLRGVGRTSMASALNSLADEGWLAVGAPMGQVRPTVTVVARLQS